MSELAVPPEVTDRAERLLKAKQSFLSRRTTTAPGPKCSRHTVPASFLAAGSPASCDDPSAIALSLFRNSNESKPQINLSRVCNGGR